jgi:hypothetical protein
MKKQRPTTIRKREDLDDIFMLPPDDAHSALPVVYEAMLL